MCLVKFVATLKFQMNILDLICCDTKVKINVFNVTLKPVLNIFCYIYCTSNNKTVYLMKLDVI